MYHGTKSDYRGFDRYDHEVDGCATIVVAPHEDQARRMLAEVR